MFCKYTMTFAQRRNRLRTHCSDYIPVVNRRISLFPADIPTCRQMVYVQQISAVCTRMYQQPNASHNNLPIFVTTVRNGWELGFVARHRVTRDAICTTNRSPNSRGKKLEGRTILLLDRTVTNKLFIFNVSLFAGYDAWMFCPVLVRYVSLVQLDRHQAERGPTAKPANPLIKALSHGMLRKNWRLHYISICRSWTETDAGFAGKLSVNSAVLRRVWLQVEHSDDTLTKPNLIKIGIKEIRQTQLKYVTIAQYLNQFNTLSLSQLLYCVLILYMFRASSVHLQEGTTLEVFGLSCVQL
jgi:hypothetical protein